MGTNFQEGSGGTVTAEALGCCKQNLGSHNDGHLDDHRAHRKVARKDQDYKVSGEIKTKQTKTLSGVALEATGVTAEEKKPLCTVLNVNEVELKMN